MDSNVKNIAILGSTGSIGTQALDIISEYPQRFRATLLTAGRNWRLLKPVDCYIKPEDLAGIDESELEKICAQSVAANPQAVADFKSGKEKAIFALYGFIKKATQGKADIKQADAILRNLMK